MEEMEVKLIKELAKVIDVECSNIPLDVCESEDDCSTCRAKQAYREGYRKITQCKDCDHFIPCEGSNEGYCIVLMRGMPIDGFCYFGKLRGKNEQQKRVD